MLAEISLDQVLFIDIETVSMQPAYENLNPHFTHLWDKKASQLKKTEEDSPETLYARAGIYAEFGKIICISAGYIYQTTTGPALRIKSFASHDEPELLNGFFKLLLDLTDPLKYNKPQLRLCAHNGKEFDFPYICRRALINGLKIPAILEVAGKKPWEILHLDTMELWKFGDYKNYTSLELLAAVFGIPTPKDDISGAEVGKVYWIDKNLERIVTYCQKDVATVAQLFLRYKGEPLLQAGQIQIVE